jgi:DNA-binding transcriptional ArsR family regulator
MRIGFKLNKKQHIISTYLDMLVYICKMNFIETNKVLSNKVRVEVLQWLKKPEENFPQQINVPDFSQGVCVCHIQDKTGLSQSTISHYLTMMHNANLLIATRIGKWTYYKRNEEEILNYINALKEQL